MESQRISFRIYKIKYLAVKNGILISEEEGSFFRLYNVQNNQKCN